MKTGKESWSFVRACVRVAETDWRLLRASMRLRVAVLAVTLVPSFYALIYLSSVWDPTAKTNALPVALVNLDLGYSYQGSDQHIGAELVRELQQGGRFGYVTLDSAEQARHAVRQGQVAFALIIPADFSAGAVPGTRAGGGKLVMVLSEGNNYAAAAFARRFVGELVQQLNEGLNEKRWEQILSQPEGAAHRLETLRAGMAQLAQGAHDYHTQMARYSATALQLTQGLKQMTASLHAVQQQLPPASELKTAREGAHSLVQHQQQLGAGLEALMAGAQRLDQGARQLHEQVADMPFVPDALTEGTRNLAAGSRQLADGLEKLEEGQERVLRGSERVRDGVARMAEGGLALEEQLGQMASQLPAPERLDAYGRHGAELVQGAARLQGGIRLVAAALPGRGGLLDANARGLADSVAAELEVYAPVANNGSAFAPNMIAMALWLGAVMALYPFHLYRIAAEHALSSRWAKGVGRFVLPAALVLAQIVLIFVVLRFGLGVAVPDVPGLAVVMVASGLAFLAIVYLLLRLLGEAGKLLVILLLTLQLAAGGGVMPIELSGDFFQAVHHWLPFTWAVHALRASLFGAFDNAWGSASLQIGLIGLLALMASARLGRWEVVADQAYRPGVDF